MCGRGQSKGNAEPSARDKYPVVQSADDRAEKWFVVQVTSRTQPGAGSQEKRFEFVRVVAHVQTVNSVCSCVRGPLQIVPGAWLAVVRFQAYH